MKDTKKKKFIKLAMAVKGFTATVGMSALIVNYKWVGITVLLIGAAANEIINYLSNKEDESKNY